MEFYKKLTLVLCFFSSLFMHVDNVYAQNNNSWNVEYNVQSSESIKLFMAGLYIALGVYVGGVIADELSDIYYDMTGVRAGSDEKTNRDDESDDVDTVDESSQKKETFDSIAGNYEAKRSLQEVVEYLQNPSACKKFGLKLPKGALLYGPPGTGKTLLAKAVAGEADCAFIYASGSEFQDMYFGESERKVRELFEKARSQGKPCIIFIDEIDAIGGKRGTAGMSSRHYDNVLNQLLAEMDGFVKSKYPIFVIGATNRKEMLDDALLRPGRLDRHIHVGLPTLFARQEILQVYLNKIPLADDINVEVLAKMTPGFAGAELENLVNEAGFVALRDGVDEVGMKHFENALDTITLGAESLDMIISEEERTVIAYHESGHALMGLLMPGKKRLHKMTISPRNGSLGAAHSMIEESHISTKDQMLAEVQALLGGRAAEELVFQKCTSGAFNDFEKATSLVKEIVCHYGMTDALGTRVIFNNENLSGQVMEKIDAEIDRILKEQYQIVMQTLSDNRDRLDKMAALLLEKNTVYATDLYELLDIQPYGNFVVA